MNNDTYAKLKANMSRMTKWAGSMSEREDTLKRPRSTIQLVTATEASTFGRQLTGHPGFDIQTHGGIPRGRYMVLFGGPGVGKSLMVGSMIVSAQQEGIVPLYLAPEGTDTSWLERQGVNLEHLILSDKETDCARILNTVDEAARGTNKVGEINLGNPYTNLIIVDSVAAMMHTEEEVKGMGGDSMALTARRLSQYFRIGNKNVMLNGVLVVFVNQIRADMDGGYLERYPGGNALMHYSALDLHIRRTGKNDFVESIYKQMFEEDKTRTGYPNKMTVRKTKLFGLPENSTSTGVIQENVGLVKELTLAQFCVEQDLVERGGASCKMATWNGKEEGKFSTSNGFGGFVDWIYENYELAYTSASHEYEKKFAAMLESRMAKFHREDNIQKAPEPEKEEEAKEPKPEKESEAPPPKKRGRPGRKKGK